MHYGLDFVFSSSPGEVKEAIKKLAKPNRITRLSEAEKKRLRIQIRERQRIRKIMEARRREGDPK